MTSRSRLALLLVAGLATMVAGRGVTVRPIIKDFEVAGYGGPLFFPSSDEWRKRHGGAS
jgi:hypothetical protein